LLRSPVLPVHTPRDNVSLQNVDAQLPRFCVSHAIKGHSHSFHHIIVSLMESTLMSNTIFLTKSSSFSTLFQTKIVLKYRIQKYQLVFKKQKIRRIYQAQALGCIFQKNLQGINHSDIK
jgi:hypothetical protein